MTRECRGRSGSVANGVSYWNRGRGILVKVSTAQRRCYSLWTDGGDFVKFSENEPADHGLRHICWDGCMFPNAMLEQQQTWSTI